jgi:pilus assembly protein Flp/PilA
MNYLFLKLCITLQNLRDREDGQDLVEYALLVALIAFAAIAGMKALAKGIDTAFNQVSTTLSTTV